MNKRQAKKFRKKHHQIKVFGKTLQKLVEEDMVKCFIQLQIPPSYLTHHPNSTRIEGQMNELNNCIELEDENE